MEYDYPDYSFTVHFPLDPRIETTTYQAPDGRSFAARTYSVTQDTGAFTITVAELGEGGTDENALVGDAVKKLTDGGIIKFDIQHRIRAGLWPPAWRRRGERRLFLRRGVLSQESTLSDRGQGVCRGRTGGGRRHALPAIAGFHLS
jgi:hypothetical protein